MTLGRISCAVVVLLVAVAVVAAAAASGSGLDNEKLIKYYREKANVPPDQKIVITNVKDSALDRKLKEGILEIGEGGAVSKVAFVVSEDGRYVVFGDVEDFSVDPMKAVMSRVDLSGYPAKGGANAKVTIVEYSDFQCPFCSRAYFTMEQVLKDYGDKVKLYFKNYPLPFHSWAEPAAIAAECARQQKPEAFWTVYRGLFEAQKELNPTNLKQKVTAMLAQSGIDMPRFNGCFDDKSSLAEVNAQKAEGLALGIRGTPGFVINGRLVSGALPIDQFKSIIDEELAE